MHTIASILVALIGIALLYRLACLGEKSNVEYLAKSNDQTGYSGRSIMIFFFRHDVPLILATILVALIIYFEIS